MSTPQELIELPLAGGQEERADAAANRQRILQAAREILEQHGFEGLTMDAVATRAGVGKGTVFRRFGDRAGLTAALLDEYMRAFQDAFLNGPPPLGPGAPAGERLEAFVLELARCHNHHLETAMAAEAARGAPPPAVGTLLVHVSALLQEIDPQLDHQALAAMILSAVSPPVLYQLQTMLGAETGAIERAALALLRGITKPPPRA